MNQKPWHPLNFRNQMKVFEAQEQAEKEAKAKAEGKVSPRPLHAAAELPQHLLTGCIKEQKANCRCTPEDKKSVPTLGTGRMLTGVRTCTSKRRLLRRQNLTLSRST